MDVLKKCFWFALGLLLVSCGAFHKPGGIPSPEAEKTFIKISPRPGQAGNKPFFDLWEGQKVVVAYYDTNHKLLIQKWDDLLAPPQQKELSVEDAAGTFVYLANLETGTGLIWRLKYGNGAKDLYFQLAPNDFEFGPPTIINRKKSAILPIFVANDKKRIFVLWADERSKDDPMYLNYSLDGGQNWLKEDYKISAGVRKATLPFLFWDGSTLYAFFFGSKEGKASLFCRISRNNGASWGELERIRTFTTWTPAYFWAGKVDERVVAIWGGPRGLEVAYRDHSGWSNPQVLAGEEALLSRLEAKQDARGRIYLVASWRLWEDKSKKDQVYFFKTEDGIHWQGPIKINHWPYDNVKARYPDIYVSQDGQVVAIAWEDHRLIRGNIFLNYSLDGGKTWQKEDLCLENEPGKYFSFWPFLKGQGSKLYVLMPRYISGQEATDYDLYLRVLDLAHKPVGRSFIPKGEELEKRKELLITRVSAMWQARLSGDWGQIYEFFDPFFRKMMSKAQFQGLPRIPIAFLDFRILSLDIKGNVANVEIEYTYEIKPFKGSFGQIIKKEPTVVVKKETWLFIDGNWFCEYVNPLVEKSFVVY